jgi:hypothetical protein
MNSIHHFESFKRALVQRSGRVILTAGTFCLGVLLLASCSGGGGTSGIQPPSTTASLGSVVLFAGDAPQCNVTSLSMTLTGMTLTPTGGGAPVSVISSANPVTVDFASLMGSSMMLGSSSVPVGSYSQMMVALSNPQMGMVNFSQGSMGYGMMTSTLSNSAVTVNLNPPLQVQANASVNMMLDLNLLQSLQTSSTGALTGTLNPVFQASVMGSGQAAGMMQRIGNLAGIVQSVSATSTNASFTGSFTLEQWMAGITFTVNVTSQTTFQGVAGLSGLTSGALVEVVGSADADGNLVASQVNSMGETNSQQSMGAFMGMVTAVTRDPGGNATQFQMGMNQEFPDMRSRMGLMAQPMVSLGQPMSYSLASSEANFAQLSLDATTLGPGQFLAVNGQVTASGSPGMMGGMGGGMSGGNAGALVANSVMLRVQPLLGTFTKVLAVGADGKTGGFALAPCSSVFGGVASIPVLTSAQTAFGSLNGLSGMAANTQVVVNGLLFYEPQLTQANGVPLAPPGWVFEATQVGTPQ